jgi:hypothetical protein
MRGVLDTPKTAQDLREEFFWSIDAAMGRVASLVELEKQPA